MLYLLSGAVAAGKTTISRAVADRLSDLVVLEEDQRPATTGEERLSNLELWIEDALVLEGEGKDVVFGSQSPLGEVLASPRAVDLEGIAPACLTITTSCEWVGRHSIGSMRETRNSNSGSCSIVPLRGLSGLDGLTGPPTTLAGMFSFAIPPQERWKRRSGLSLLGSRECGMKVHPS